jgi:hypothetical protein
LQFPQSDPIVYLCHGAGVRSVLRTLRAPFSSDLYGGRGDSKDGSGCGAALHSP